MQKNNPAYFLILLFLSCSGNPENNSPASVDKSASCPYDSLIPYYEALGKPVPGQWLYDHKENDQSFAEYCKDDPRRPDAFRKVIYIRPMGNFNTENLAVMESVASFFRSFFGLEAKILPAVSADIVPASARRTFNAHTQLHSRYILDYILAPGIPPDAITYIAFTDYDLYPDPDWNFVFGQASLKNGVGVWSYFQYGNPDDPAHEKLEFLKRVIRTAGHETGHMFSLRHCVKYNCIMNGSNSLYESDHNPLYLCPDCLHKLCWNLNMDPKEHFKKMALFWEEQNVLTTSAFYRKCLKKLPEKGKK